MYVQYISKEICRKQWIRHHDCYWICISSLT